MNINPTKRVTLGVHKKHKADPSLEWTNYSFSKSIGEAKFFLKDSNDKNRTRKSVQHRQTKPSEALIELCGGPAGFAFTLQKVITF